MARPLDRVFLVASFFFLICFSCRSRTLFKRGIGSGFRLEGADVRKDLSDEYP